MNRQRNSLIHVTVVSTVILTIACALPAWSQTYKVIFNFDAATVGTFPYAPLTLDGHGNLYGTAFSWNGSDPFNCSSGCGSVFRLSPNGSGGWNGTAIHIFSGPSGDGGSPEAPVVFDHLGNLYGSSNSDGVVFKLTPTPQGPWAETILHRYGTFGNCGPLIGFTNCSVAFGNDGRLYGSTLTGETCSSLQGGVFQLRQVSVTGWHQLYINCFIDGTTAQLPQGLLAFDAGNNIYGTSVYGGTANFGTVYRLTPNQGSQNWTQTVLYSFQGGPADGSQPQSGVVVDSLGNVYGTTPQGGSGGVGVVFMLTPQSDGTWTETILHHFNEGNGDAAYPDSTLTFDSFGNLYGTAAVGGQFDQGAVFKLTPSSGGHWTESVVYSFTGGLDGGLPYGGVTIDSYGILYGTASIGGENDDGGVAYSIQP